MARDVYLEGNDDGISRRDFLKKLGYGVGGLFAGGALLDSFLGEAQAGEMVAQKEAEAAEARASVPQKKDYLKIAILDFDGGYLGDMKDVYRDPVNLEKSIPAMLTSEINGGMIRVVPIGSINRILRENGYDMDDFREDPSILAGKVDLDGVIKGNYALVYGGKLIISSSYIDMKTGLVSETQNVEGGGNKLPRLIEELRSEIVVDLSKYYPD